MFMEPGALGLLWLSLASAQAVQPIADAASLNTVVVTA